MNTHHGRTFTTNREEPVTAGIFMEWVPARFNGTYTG